MTRRATQTLLSLSLRVSHQLLKVPPKTRGLSHEHTYPSQGPGWAGGLLEGRHHA